MRNPRNSARHHVGLVLALAGLMSGVTLMTAPVRLVSAQVTAPSRSYTGSLNTSRFDHTATLLPNGKVLVVGGRNFSCSPRCYYTVTNSAELYDPTTGTWSYTDSLKTNRYFHTATLLPNGLVLVTGGFYSDDNFVHVTHLKSAELYDPATGKWRPTGSFIAIQGYSATLLPNGKVLAVGNAAIGDPATSAELYDPATETWSSTAAPSAFPFGLMTVTLLSNGKVLVTGPKGYGSTAIAELYDPATGTWSVTSNLNVVRDPFTATLLQNGKVLVTGNDESASPTIAELYDPATGAWSVTGNLNTKIWDGAALPLPNGKVLMAGGSDSNADVVDSAELYDPAAGTWSTTSNLLTARQSHTATLLSNSRVLIAGGINGNLYGLSPPRSLSSAELYTPAVSITNQIDEAQFFVRQHYRDFLNREPDAGGLAYWTDRITSCGSDARCIHERRVGVSAAFFIALEFQDTGYYVYRFYKASYGRQPNYTEFTSDRSRVIGGSNLDASKQAFADEWVQRTVFRDAYPITMSNTEVVNKLFDSAGLTGSLYDSQRQQEIQAMNAGRSRVLVLRDVIEIPDFKNIPDPNDPRYAEVKKISQYNPAFVLMQYFGYLRRNVDQRGYDFWLDILNNRDPNNFTGMVCSFITSTEYQLRFGSVATHSDADCAR